MVVSISKMNTILFLSVILVLDIASSRYGRHDYCQATSNVAEDTYQNDEPEHTQDYLKSKPLKNMDNIIKLWKMLKSNKDVSVYNHILGLSKHAYPFRKGIEKTMGIRGVIG